MTVARAPELPVEYAIPASADVPPMQRLKSAMYRTARSAGLFKLVGRSAWRRRRLLVLCYHGVSIDDEHEWNPDLYMTQEGLRERLRLLRDGGYTVLPLAEGIDRMYRGTLPPRSVALTFDDGAHDFSARALPVLREFGAPATVYLTTYYAEHRVPVFDVAVAYVLWKGGDRVFDGTGLAPGLGAVRLGDPHARADAHQRILAHAGEIGLTTEEKDGVLREVARRAGVDYDCMRTKGMLQIMSPEEVKALPRDLVSVELHTHRHRMPLDRELFVREIEDNRRRILALAPSPDGAVHFCYPSGVYDPQFFPWLRESQVRSATTCVPGLSSPASDPLLLPRFVDTARQSAEAFEGWASGFAELLPRRGVRL